MSNRFRLLLPAALLTVLVAAPAAHADAPDAWVTTKVKIALMTSRDVHGSAISVDTYDGHVTLHGKVGSARERAEAARLAMRVNGVQDVRDLLEVVPEGQRRFVNSRDDRLERMVTRALRNDDRLDRAHIGVKSVDAGMVLLSGRARSDQQLLAALEDASEVPGVRHVESEIRTWDESGSQDGRYGRYDRRNDDEDDDARSPRRPGGHASDAWITTRTKLAYVADPEIPAHDIGVDTRHRIVTLFGTVPSEQVRQKAARVARQVDGVRGVRDELHVVPRDDRRRAMMNDDEISRTIQRRLDGRDLGDAHIHVQVRAGVVRLSGTVEREADRYSALVVARSVDGVRSVRDDLRVDPERTSVR